MIKALLNWYRDWQNRRELSKVFRSVEKLRAGKIDVLQMVVEMPNVDNESYNEVIENLQHALSKFNVASGGAELRFDRVDCNSWNVTEQIERAHE